MCVQGIGLPYPILPILYKSGHRIKFNRVGKTLNPGRREGRVWVKDFK